MAAGPLQPAKKENAPPHPSPAVSLCIEVQGIHSKPLIGKNPSYSHTVQPPTRQTIGARNAVMA